MRSRFAARSALLGLLLVTLFAGGLRAYALSSPGAVVWDEWFYARDACLEVKGPVKTCHRAHEQSNVHPPLGKRLIAIGIRLFGFTPFGWRIAAWAAGTLTVALLYLLALRLFGSAGWALFSAGLLAIDPLHFVHSRTATLDVFVTLFVVAATLFAVLDRDRDPGGGRFRPWLALCGISVGLAIASKWSGVLIILGLLPLFVAWAPPGQRRRAALTAATWLVVVPAVVYAASYAGRLHSGALDWPLAFARRQLHMLRFHIDLSSGQQYQSRPWEWLAIKRPIAYFFTDYGGRYREVIAIGTPFVWWPGAVGVLVAVWSTLRARSAKGAAPVIAACGCACYLPWFALASDRGFVFISYILPVVPFLCLGAALLARGLWSMRLPGRAVVSIVTAMAVGWFVFYYPVMTARPLSSSEWQQRIFLRDCGRAMTQTKYGPEPVLTTFEYPPSGWCWA
ncbi:MAG: dolichyl-phosphate-mannose-protein mannosyltransferase [Gaiellales bacterium]|nr:dolichyl-phosphate-mannose-protein mannosyltransferase [Gaiellales bacterium]